MMTNRPETNSGKNEPTPIVIDRGGWSDSPARNARAWAGAPALKAEVWRDMPARLDEGARDTPATLADTRPIVTPVSCGRPNFDKPIVLQAETLSTDFNRDVRSAPFRHCDEKAHLGPYPGFGPAIASTGGSGSSRQADGKPGPAPTA